MLENKRRIHMLDEIRGFAIICMIFHHAFLDVGDVLGLEWGYRVFDALCIVQPIFWVIFIMISGMCSRLSRNTAKRGVIVLACGGIITLFTAVLMPLFGFVGAEIYFGILHCLGACMIIAGLLMPIIKKVNYKAGAAVTGILFLMTCDIERGTLCFGQINLPDSWYQHNLLAPIGIHSTSFFSADYFSIIPWVFMFLCGAFIGKLAAEEFLPEIMYEKHSKFLSLVGKNSLWVYLAHQPIIYAVFFIISLFLN